MAFPLNTLKPQPPSQFQIVDNNRRPVQPWQEYMRSIDAMLHTGQSIALATPNNANAAAAGVPLGGMYTDTADPAKIYIRTI
jgi:mitochondrial fission protein ELM1